MAGPSRAKRAGLLAVAVIATAAAGIGVTQAGFTGQTDEEANRIAAAPDWRGPTVAPIVVGKSAGNATGYIRTGGTYRIWANVTDVGTPPSGTSTVTANVSSLTAGQTAVPLVAGSYTAGGVSYNYRSAILTAGALANGSSQGFSVTATDAASNATTANGSVTVDSTAPAPTNISASGGVAGRPEVGDVLTLTTNDTLDTFSLLANWTGAATTVQVRFVNNAGADRLQVWNSAGTTQVPFGTIALGRTDFTTSTLSFNGSTMTQAAGVITITLGAPVVGTVTTVGGTGTMVWTPSATATDRAGNAMPTAAFNEPAPADRDF
jgi:hypothetical protein